MCVYCQSNHSLPRKSKLEVIVQVIQIDEEISEVSAQTAEKHPVTQLLGEADEEHPHPLVELLVPQTQQLHGCLAHLDDLTFREVLIDDEGVLKI